MSAGALQPKQFAAHMPAHELMKIGADVPSNFHEVGWRTKLHEAKDEGFWNLDFGSIHASIHRNGIINPVEVEHYDTHSELVDGHHRVAVAHEIDPHYPVPVTHRDYRTRR